MVEKDGVFYLSVTSSGTTGEQWIKRLEDKKINVHEEAEAFLLSDEFNGKLTDGKIYNVAIIRAWLLPHKKIYINEMKTEGYRRGFTLINPEAACLILDQINEVELEKMSVTFTTLMSENKKDLFVFARNKRYGSFIDCFSKDRKDPLLKTSGFAFEDPDSKGEK